MKLELLVFLVLSFSLFCSGLSLWGKQEKREDECIDRPPSPNFRSCKEMWTYGRYTEDEIKDDCSSEYWQKYCCASCEQSAQEEVEDRRDMDQRLMNILRRVLHKEYTNSEEEE